MLRQMDAPLVGVALNAIRRHHGAYGACGSRYGYYGYSCTEYYRSQNGSGRVAEGADRRETVAATRGHGP